MSAQSELHEEMPADQDAGTVTLGDVQFNPVTTQDLRYQEIRRFNTNLERE